MIVDKYSYSSPQALLNRYFRKQDKFQMTIGDECFYENRHFILIHIEGETFDLIEKRYDSDSGPYEHEHGSGLLIDLVQKIRKLGGKI